MSICTSKLIINICTRGALQVCFKNFTESVKNSLYFDQVSEPCGGHQSKTLLSPMVLLNVMGAADVGGHSLEEPLPKPRSQR